jgi:hypothetical protein
METDPDVKDTVLSKRSEVPAAELIPDKVPDTVPWK